MEGDDINPVNVAHPGGQFTSLTLTQRCRLLFTQINQNICDPINDPGCCFPPLSCLNLTDSPGKLSLEAIQVVFEELRKKGMVVLVSPEAQSSQTGFNLSAVSSQGTWSGRTRTRAAAWSCGDGRRSGPSSSTSG